MPERALRVGGRVLEALPNALYRVELQTEGRPEVTAHVGGEAGLLRLLPGQAVEVEVSSFDRTRGRIVSRDAPRSAARRDLMKGGRSE
jgi:translation initiation factor IF-1